MYGQERRMLVRLAAPFVMMAARSVIYRSVVVAACHQWLSSAGGARRPDAEPLGDPRAVVEAEAAERRGRRRIAVRALDVQLRA
jgi:hypothetical protein